MLVEEEATTGASMDNLTPDDMDITCTQSPLPGPAPPGTNSSANAGASMVELSPAMVRRPKVLIIDLGRAFYFGDDLHFAQTEMRRLDKLLRAAS